LTIRSVLAAARVWLGLLVLSTVIGAAVSLLVALNTPPNYIGKTTLVVSPRTTLTDLTIADVDTARAVATTLADVSTTAPVLERAIVATGSSVDLPSLEGSVQTSVPAGTSIIEISVTDRDPATAGALANGIAAALVRFSNDDVRNTAALNFVLSVVDRADRPSQVPRLALSAQVALGGAIGLLISISLAAIVETLGRTPQWRARGATGSGLSRTAWPH
jgi:succinoglycan biosynthesis transport protein ExoP